MSTFLINVPPEPKFWRRHCSTGLEWNSCMKFCQMFPPPEPKSWSRYWYNCTLYIIVVLGQYSFRTSENGNAVLCNYIDFDVIFQKIVQYKFYSTLIAGWAGSGRKTILPAGPEISARLTSLLF